MENGHLIKDTQKKFKGFLLIEFVGFVEFLGLFKQTQ